MAELYAEQGIGETRRILVEKGRIARAWVDWGETLIVGSRVRAKIVRKLSAKDRFLAETADGEAIWVNASGASLTEGSHATIQILRAPIGEAGRRKPATGYVTEGEERLWTHLERARENGRPIESVRRFPVEGWDEIAELALTAKADFPGGAITITPTPAMTLIDVDGYDAALAQCLAAIPVIADSLQRLDLHGSIGIDFPTVQQKADRQKVDTALRAALQSYPCEQTAMNGFGFVQLVGRVDGPSILHRYTFSRTAACARIALRRAEHLEGPGVTLLTIHPAVKAKLTSRWLDELRRRTGRDVRIETNPELALEAPQAQLVNS